LGLKHCASTGTHHTWGPPRIWVPPHMAQWVNFPRLVLCSFSEEPVHLAAHHSSFTSGPCSNSGTPECRESCTLWSGCIIAVWLATQLMVHFIFQTSWCFLPKVCSLWVSVWVWVSLLLAIWPSGGMILNSFFLQTCCQRIHCQF